MKIVEHEEYVDTEEAIELLGISRQTFYANARPLLEEYRFNAKKKPWYKKCMVMKLNQAHPAQKRPFVLTSILKDWTAYARSLGIPAQTISSEIVTTTMPESAVKHFGLPADKLFVKRGRATIAKREFLCTWDTYYPLELVEDDLEEIKHNPEYSIVQGIKARHGLVISHAKEYDYARLATLKEQEQMQLKDADAILVLQRASYARDTLILFSDMALRGEWFAIE